jgi:hypothetical protein
MNLATMKNHLSGGVSSRWSHFSFLLPTIILSISCLMLSSCSGKVTGGTRAIVVPEILRLRSSTAQAARIVGEVKGGETVTIRERIEAEGTPWAHITGPDGQDGWAPFRSLIPEEAAVRSKQLAEETKDVGAQAVGRSKASLKLRSTPDRTTEENVLTLLPSGTTVDIIARERKPRPATVGGEGEGATDPKFDEWYQVRLPDNKVTPAGWIYGGSIELQVPPEISYYVSFGRKIVGWQRLAPGNSAEGQSNDPYLVLERTISEDEDGIDFDRLKVLAYDDAARDYYTPFREDLRGQFPVIRRADSGRGTFQFKVVSATGTSPVDFSYETVGGGRLKVTRVTPKEPAAAKRKR